MSMATFSDSVPQQTKKSFLNNKWIALALCVFTGCAHRFYEGDIKMGFVYLYTLGLFGIGWIYDIIRLLVVSNSNYTTRNIF